MSKEPTGLGELLGLLCCPQCRGELKRAGEGLECPRCRLRYPIRDGIPVMLVAEAEKLPEE